MMNKVGLYIKHEREARGMSLRDLAVQSGVTHSHIWNVEWGNCDITIMHLERIAEAFKLSLVEFLIAAGYEYDPALF